MILCELIIGLRDLHTGGIIHRDIKPENIFIKEDGHIVLGVKLLFIFIIVSFQVILVFHFIYKENKHLKEKDFLELGFVFFFSFFF
jgi:serine/threonine protein kinase